MHNTWNIMHFILVILITGNVILAFTTQSQTSSRTATQQQGSTVNYLFPSPKSSPLEDEPWKANDSYWDMLQQASKDPETFEKFIEESMAKKKLAKGGSGGGVRSSTVVSSASLAANGSAADASTANSKAPKKSKYVPIEEWDEQRKNGENMSAEERLQWECQRNGNQFRQNEILSHHLNSF